MATKTFHVQKEQESLCDHTVHVRLRYKMVVWVQPHIVIFLFCYRRAEENSINLNFPLALQTEILNFSPWTFGHRQKSSILKRQFKRVWAHGRPGQGHWQIGFETSDPQKGGLLTCAGGHIHLPCSIAGLKPAKAAAQAQELWAHDFYLDSNL